MHTFISKKMYLKILTEKCWPCCLDLNVFNFVLQFNFFIMMSIIIQYWFYHKCLLWMLFIIYRQVLQFNLFILMSIIIQYWFYHKCLLWMLFIIYRQVLQFNLFMIMFIIIQYWFYHKCLLWMLFIIYRQVSNISRTKSQHLKDSRTVFAAVFAKSLETRCQVQNEDVVRAVPTGDAPTTSEWSTILLPTNVRLILEILR